MIKNLNSITDKNIDPAEMDTILKAHVKAKFDKELKLEIARDLKQQYQIAKENKLVHMESKKRRTIIYWIAGVAAAISLLILAISFFNGPSAPALAGDPPPWPDETEIQKLAANYLTTSEIHHSAALKGNTETEELRTQAIQAFNTKDYAAARQLFAQIEDKTEEDIFYGAIASLYDQKYEDAITNLSSVAESGTTYKEAANWYLARGSKCQKHNLRNGTLKLELRKRPGVFKGFEIELPTNEFD